MSETKHTPGPWKLDGMYVTADPSTSRPPSYVVVAFVSEGTGQSPERREANASLIAAAPDLLAALKHCVIERSEWLEEARAAIAKAEGRQP